MQYLFSVCSNLHFEDTDVFKQRDTRKDGMPLTPLTRCHRHIFLTAFRIPLSIKITGTQRVPVVFMGWIMGFEPTTFRATI